MSDKDGLEKNLDKLKIEFNKLSEEMKPHWARLREDKDTHAYVNLFVESRRCSPYLTGHIDAIVYPLLVVSLIILAVR